MMNFYLPQNTTNDRTRQKTNGSGEETQKETMGLIDIGLSQSKKILG